MTSYLSDFWQVKMLLFMSKFLVAAFLSGGAAV